MLFDFLFNFNESVKRFLDGDWRDADSTIEYWRYQKLLGQLGDLRGNNIVIEGSEMQDQKIEFHLASEVHTRLLTETSLNASVMRGILAFYKLYDFTTPIEGVAELDFEKTPIELFQKAAAAGHIIAYKILCDLYEHGNISRINYVEIISACEKVINLGSDSDKAIALNLLGHIYEQGFGVLQDYTKSQQYYEQAINLDESSALMNLGYLHGERLRNYPQAKDYCERSAKLGNVKAFAYLGYLYEYGLGVTMDAGKMIRNYHQAAMLGNTIALTRLGYTYERRELIEIAEDYYMAAGHLGEAHALESLARLCMSFERGFKLAEYFWAQATKITRITESNEQAAKILGGNFDNLDYEPINNVLVLLESTQDNVIQIFLKFFKITAYLFQRKEKNTNYDYQIRVNDFWQLIHHEIQPRKEFIAYLKSNPFEKKILHSNTYLNLRKTLHHTISSISDDDFTRGRQLYLNYLSWHSTRENCLPTQREVLAQLLGKVKPYVMIRQSGFFSRIITGYSSTNVRSVMELKNL